MKLEKFKKNKKRKKIVITSVIGILVVIGSIFLYRTYAYYEEAKTYNVLQGKVGDFGYDIKLAVTLDGVKQDSVPARGLYKTEISCKDRNGNQVSTGSWDYNNWSLIVENLQYETKCNVAFTSNLTQEEYDKYIDAGIALRRNTYRGKDITSYHIDGSLYTMISGGTFDDIYVGDYIIANNVTWLIADLDNYLNSGDTSLTKHHVTIIPSTPLQYSPMNATNTTEGGYAGSDMVTTTLNEVLSTYVTPAFENHIITYRNILSNTIDNARISAGFGTTNSGASSNWAWYDRQIDLMSETNVYGTNVFSSSGYDTGIDDRQYAIFQLKPQSINCYGNSRFSYWLKNVTNSTAFALVVDNGGSGGGQSSYWSSSLKLGVRPRFLIG